MSLFCCAVCRHFAGCICNTACCRPCVSAAQNEYQFLPDRQSRLHGVGARWLRLLFQAPDTFRCECPATCPSERQESTPPLLEFCNRGSEIPRAAWSNGL